MTCNAVVAVTASAGVTESPCALNSRQNKTTFSTSSSDIRADPWQLCLKRRDVALIFQKTPERLGDDLFVQLGRLQGNERVGPIQRLRHAGDLREAHRPRRLHHFRNTPVSYTHLRAPRDS